ncbi:MAG: 50S ribosomal protein L17, partial [Myxococcales bacterium]|nr:50S ribosomal protein L17 [Myxococcales bacterium]
MRHRVKAGILGRSASHRTAMYRNLVTSLFEHERVRTTDAKAKGVRSLAEKMITLGKRGDLHARRRALRVIRRREVAAKVFDDLAERYRDRPGGYTRIVKLGIRPGDAASMSIIELVESGKIEKLAAPADDDRRMAIRRECKKYASKFIKLQSQQMQRLLTLADYDNPYLTMTPAYEKAVLEVFAALVDEGLVYRALKPVHWSIANQTALAEAEMEYYEKQDVSVYVDFEAVDRDAVATGVVIELAQTP